MKWQRHLNFTMVALFLLAGTSCDDPTVPEEIEEVEGVSVLPPSAKKDVPLGGYNLIPLEDLGGNQSQAWDINDKGQVVGRATIAASPGGPYTAFLWEDGEMTDLHPSVNSQAFGINNLGQVAGVVGVAGTYYAAMWEDGVFTNLGSCGVHMTEAWDINDGGQVVGHCDPVTQGVYHAFFLENGVFTLLGTLGGDRSRATAINNKGQVVGFDPSVGAFLWEDDVMTPLTGLYQAWDINDEGQVVGWCPSGAALWEDGVLTELGHLGTVEQGVAYGINNLGQIVGGSSVNGELHAFLWEEGVMTDLGAIPGDRSNAQAINIKGEVAGWGDPQDLVPPVNDMYALLWTKKKEKKQK